MLTTGSPILDQSISNLVLAFCYLGYRLFDRISRSRCAVHHGELDFSLPTLHERGERGEV